MRLPDPHVDGWSRAEESTTAHGLFVGSSNHEIAYRNTVLLLNAHYARTPPARPLRVCPR